MKTLYLRNVPLDVDARLRSLAEREGLSVSAFAVRELSRLAERADNAALLGDLPDLAITPAEAADAVDAGRADR